MDQGAVFGQLHLILLEDEQVPARFDDVEPTRTHGPVHLSHDGSGNRGFAISAGLSDAHDKLFFCHGTFPFALKLQFSGSTVKYVIKYISCVRFDLA